MHQTTFALCAQSRTFTWGHQLAAWFMACAMIVLSATSPSLASPVAASTPVLAVTQSQSYKDLWDTMSQMAALDQRTLSWSEVEEQAQADGSTNIRLSFVAVRHFRTGPHSSPMARGSTSFAEIGGFDAVRPYGEVRAVVRFDEARSEWVLVDFHYRPTLF